MSYHPINSDSTENTPPVSMLKLKVFGDIIGGTQPVQSQFLFQQTPKTIKYYYDTTGNRIEMEITTTQGATLTIYPSDDYNITTTGQNSVPEITKHLFANGADVATINITGSDTKIYYNHPDSLQSSSIMTDTTGTIAETMDYYPFGQIRIDNKTTTLSEQRKYIGQEYDEDTNLNHLNARYYNSAIGRFISQDPLVITTPEKFLADPQQLNSYSYARNNPIVSSDPTGLMPTVMEAAIMANQIYQNGREGNNLTGGWGYNYSLTGGDGMKMGVYSRMQNDAQCIPLEYALVSKGTSSWFGSDALNNIGQPFGQSADVIDSIKQTRNFVKEHPENEITSVGHSKGGPEAEAGAVATGNNAILFNPARANLSSYGLDYSSYKGNINTYIVNGEILSSTEGLVSKPIGNVTYLPMQHSISSFERFMFGPTISSSMDTYNSIQNHKMSSVISALNNR